MDGKHRRRLNSEPLDPKALNHSSTDLYSIVFLTNYITYFRVRHRSISRKHEPIRFAYKLAVLRMMNMSDKQPIRKKMKSLRKILKTLSTILFEAPNCS